MTWATLKRGVSEAAVIWPALARHRLDNSHGIARHNPKSRDKRKLADSSSGVVRPCFGHSFGNIYSVAAHTGIDSGIPGIVPPYRIDIVAGCLGIGRYTFFPPG
jgi:hypothetical protein